MRRTRFFSTLAALVLLSALSACRPQTAGPPPLDFETDPLILRGVWTGQSDSGDTLRLAIRAGPTFEGGYEVEGVFDLNGETYTEFTGLVAVPKTASTGALSRQLTPACGPFNAFAQVGAWQLCGTAPAGSGPSFQMSLESDPASYAFTVTKLPDTTELPVKEDAPIVTNATRYTPQVTADDVTYTVQATYTNRTSASVYLAPCGYEPPVFGLKRLEVGVWIRTGVGGLCQAVGGVPDIEVKPGKSFSATVNLSAAVPSPATPLFGVDLLPGVHRLSFVVTNTPRTGDGDEIEPDELLPAEQRVSNAFVLEAP